MWLCLRIGAGAGGGDAASTAARGASRGGERAGRSLTSDGGGAAMRFDASGTVEQLMQHALAPPSNSSSSSLNSLDLEIEVRGAVSSGYACLALFADDCAGSLPGAAFDDGFVLSAGDPLRLAATSDDAGGGVQLTEQPRR